MTGPTPAPTPRTVLVRQLRELGLRPGSVVLVHTSFRAVRPVEGGPDGLIDALEATVGPDGTVVMPSWSDDEGVFDPERSRADPDLGVVAERFRRRHDVRRSDHPHAFAAKGPHASEILRDPLPLPPHVAESPVGRVRDLDGFVLLLGVNHDADTTIHLAELEAGVRYRVPKHLAVVRDGAPAVIEYGENDHCCARFRLVDAWLEQADAQVRGPVGQAEARLARSRDIVRVVVQRLRPEPTLFLHDGGEGCTECDLARASLDEAPEGSEAT